MRPLSPQVSYADGTSGDHWLGTERVRVQYHPGEHLPAPDAGTLHKLAQKYLDQAERLQQQQHQQLQTVGADAAGISAVVEDEVMPVQDGGLGSALGFLVAYVGSAGSLRFNKRGAVEGDRISWL